MIKNYSDSDNSISTQDKKQKLLCKFRTEFKNKRFTGGVDEITEYFTGLFKQALEL